MREGIDHIVNVTSGAGMVQEAIRKINRDRRNKNSKRKGSKGGIGTWSGTYKAKFKELPPEELELLKEKIRQESLKIRRRTMLIFGILVACTTLLGLLLFL